MSKLRAGCVQMRSGTDQKQNLVVMEDLVRQAASQGAMYIQTPEMTGIVQKDVKALFNSIENDADNSVFAVCEKLSQELGIWLHLGSTAVKLSETNAVNRAALFSPVGKRVAIYDKIHMFDVDVSEQNSWRESKVYEAGDISPVIDIGEFKIGLAICYDLRFPKLFRAQAKAGAQILTCPAAFTRPTGEAHWETLLRARAIENGAFMIAAEQGGIHEDGRETWGRSTIVSPWGKIIGCLDHNEPGVLVCDLDLEQVATARQSIPVLTSEREFEISLIEHKPSI